MRKSIFIILAAIFFALFISHPAQAGVNRFSQVGNYSVWTFYDSIFNFEAVYTYSPDWPNKNQYPNQTSVYTGYPFAQASPFAQNGTYGRFNWMKPGYRTDWSVTEYVGAGSQISIGYVCLPDPGQRGTVLSTTRSCEADSYSVSGNTATWKTYPFGCGAGISYGASATLPSCSPPAAPAPAPTPAPGVVPAAPTCVSNYGSSCNSVPNACGKVNTGTIACDGSCTAATPSNNICIPPTVSISASPQSVSYGAPSTISWSSTNAASCSISPTGWTGVSGTRTRSLTSDTTYTANCTGPGGTASNSITVAVGPPPPPTAVIIADSTAIPYNAYTIIRWNSTNAASCSVSPSGWTGRSGARFTNYLTASQTYTISCRGPGGTVSKSVKVNVGPAQPGISITADNSIVPYNGSTVIRWNAANVDSCTVSPNGWTGVSGAKFTNSLTSSQIYTVSCSGPSGQISQSVTVEVSPPAPAVANTATLSLSPNSVDAEIDKNFDVAVTVDPHSVKNYFVKAEIQFPPDFLEIKSFKFEDVWIPLTVPGYDLIDNINGLLIKTAGYPGGFGTAQKFGTITFSAKKSGAGVITTTSNSPVILNEGGQNVWNGSASQVNINVSAAGAPLPAALPSTAAPPSAPTPTTTEPLLPPPAPAPAAPPPAAPVAAPTTPEAPEAPIAQAPSAAPSAAPALPSVSAPAVFDNFDQLDGWIAQGDASGLVADATQKTEGNASLSFNIDPAASDGAAASLLKSGLNYDFTNYYQNGAAFGLWVYLPTANFTSIDLVFGTDPNNYYRISAATQADGSPWVANGWNYLVWNFGDAVVFGTPDLSRVTFIRIDFNEGPGFGAVSNARVDDFTVAAGVSALTVPQTIADTLNNLFQTAIAGISDLRRNPAVVSGIKNIAAPVAVAVTAVSAGVLAVTGTAGSAGATSNFSEFLTFLEYLRYFLPGFVTLKRKVPWGTIRDKFGNRPISGAIVEIHEAEFRKIKDVQITDREGRFDVLAEPGNYYVKVSANGFEQYQSGIIAVQSAGQMLNLEFHLVPEEIMDADIIKKINFWNALKRLVEIINPYLLAVGTAVSGVSLLIVPGPFNAVVFALYIALDALKIYFAFHFIKPFGSVIDGDTKLPIALAVVRIYNEEKNTLLQTKATDEKGRFNFLLAPGRYFVTASKAEYAMYRSNPLELFKAGLAAIDIELGRRVSEPPQVPSSPPSSAEAGYGGQRPPETSDGGLPPAAPQASFEQRAGGDNVQ